MVKEEERLMAYIDGEVRTLCTRNDWLHQIRRAWHVREKPVSASGIADYEWKITPRRPESSRPIDDGFEGIYYVLRVDMGKKEVILDHSNSYAGVWGPHFERRTCTYISLSVLDQPFAEKQPDALPAAGWLVEHLLDLTHRFRPNLYSIT